MKATVENIKEVIAEAEVLGNASEMVSNVPLRDQGIDSLDVVNVYLLLEEKFDVKIPDEDLEQVQTIDAIVEYINSKLN
ncbi:acyl carrier protein [Arcobacter cryaerophilus gv. pseudocryaerophilus]|uniref:Acyl carrier protein n=3 Tax=unclassified Arcobacter TaxID=2593671 RepID=A0AA96L524_9BACT|nr:acyl carrier protein [Arcobacter sp. AZ-2023]WPD05194.1 acyl carrier protein [Arcobacter sp. DSM 115956]WPD07288.1 acyl carrier protein [Arcobacter sp. DSM 115955]WNL31553.1 acyl carrier protein [Arcobacter sp. AZ-2023]WNP37703.1 acyl carrier protein [Arcobacter sp. AZ-2023]